MRTVFVRLTLPLFCCLVVLLILGPMGSLAAQDEMPAATSGQLTATMQRIMAGRIPPENLAPLGATPCVGGVAGGFPCSNIDLLAFMPLNTIGGTGGTEGNDIWGWTDPQTNKEYALMGLTNGTAFVDISNPTAPIFLGHLATATFSSIWRDIKVYADHAFIVADFAGSHGVQVFDLTRLRNVTNPPVTFTEDGNFHGVGSAHNIVINEATGYAYAVGGDTCNGGLHFINLQNPTSPTDAGCFSSDGYTHDAQCVVYTGPDTTYQGHEICFNSNEDTVTIVDVTNKAAPAQLAREPYPGSSYTHQGWVTEDQRYLLVDDEGDEFDFGHSTRTYVWDIADLNDPVLLGSYTAAANIGSVDHNLYVVGDLAYEANYSSGLRILDISNVSTASLTEVGYFDVYTANNSANYNGAWSVYPFFSSGVVIVSGIEQGLFILDPQLGAFDAQFVSEESVLSAPPGNHVTHTFELENLGDSDSYELVVSDNSWATTLLTSTPLAIPGGSSAFIEVEVHVPTNAAAPQDTFTLTITSTNDPGLVLTATGTTRLTGTVFLPTVLHP